MSDTSQRHGGDPEPHDDAVDEIVRSGPRGAHALAGPRTPHGVARGFAV